MKIIQKIINTLYRYPLSTYKRYQRFGGYAEHRKIIRGRKEMAAASLKLPPVASYSDGLPVYFLTGKNYLYQTLFCIQSLSKVTPVKFRFNLVDDGTFDNDLIGLIAKQLPGTNIITSSEIELNLQRHLPIADYPFTHAKRKIYPHLRKITDIHTISGDDYKLVLDSDMLFWNEPVALLEWLKKPGKPIHMIDCVESYGYSHDLMEALSGKPLPKLINVGVIGLKSSAISWPELDSWIKTMEVTEGASYYLEQALTAMLIGEHTISLSQEKYIVNPGQLNFPHDTLHHYVDLSKKLYFQQAWRYWVD